jgi:hypothetical protein
MVQYQQEKKSMAAKNAAKQEDAPATYESVWALLQKVGRMQEETDRRMEETARQMKETDKKIGKLSSRFGEVVEYMVVPNLVAKFNEMGYDFGKSSSNVIFQDFEHRIFAEVDAYLENGDYIMIVETKVTPTIDDVKDHIERMKKIRSYADFHDDKHKFLGAIAGAVIHENVREYILKQGFYAVVPSGETFDIISPKDNKPREW